MASTEDADRWLHDLTVDEAARRRGERADLDQLQAETSTFVDGIAGIAADGREVRLELVSGAIAGRLAAVGPDVVAVVAGDRHHLVALEAIVSAEPGESVVDVRSVVPRTPATLLERLRLEAMDGRGLTITLADGRIIAGRLNSVGADAVVVDRRPQQATIHIARQSLVLVSG